MTPVQIIRQAYVRIGAYQGTAAQISTAYGAGVTGLNTESFPLQSMYDMLTSVENEIATAIASNANSVLRRVLHDTATVVSGAAIPVLGAGGGAIIGVWGQVRDAATGIELTPNLHEDEIRTLNNSSIFITSYYSYALRPPRIYATVANVEIDVCTFDQAARQTAITANGALLFPQCENAYFDGLMANLKNEDDRLIGLSNQFTDPYQAWLQSLNPAPRDVVSEAAA